TLSASSPCATVDANTVTCPLAHVKSVVVDGGDGDDRIESTNPIKATLIGGAGDDQLISGPGDSELDGGPGDDALDGGLGSDVLDGGDGGADFADYSKRTENLHIDQNHNGDDGAPGEDDSVLPSVEHVIGGSGNDVISEPSADAGVVRSLFGGDGDD